MLFAPNTLTFWSSYHVPALIVVDVPVLFSSASDWICFFSMSSRKLHSICLIVNGPRKGHKATQPRFGLRCSAELSLSLLLHPDEDVLSYRRSFLWCFLSRLHLLISLSSRCRPALVPLLSHSCLALVSISSCSFLSDRHAETFRTSPRNYH